MGGDFGPRVTVPAVLSLLHLHPGLCISLFGDESAIRPFLPENFPADALQVQHCDQSLSMDAKPSMALKQGQQTSLYRAVASLREVNHQHKAVVSAGNTGAFMVIAKHLLGTFDGIDRPAICAPLPSINGRTWLLDLGANIDCPAERLYQYAQMGTVLVRCLEGIDAPRVALLNIGSEQLKGGASLKEAASLIGGDSRINYAGFVEGNDVFTGDVDVVVCDGFVGNILIKASQGAARFISEQLGKQAGAEPDTAELQRFVSGFRSQINPARYNGASFLGLQGTAVVSHGSAGQEAFSNAIALAVKESQRDLPRQLSLYFKP